jgi:C4-dicarboxylate transporter
MDRVLALFSFRGRASRLTYWRIGLATTAVWAVLWIAVIFVAMGAGDAAIIPLLLVLPVMAVNLGRDRLSTRHAWRQPLWPPAAQRPAPAQAEVSLKAAGLAPRAAVALNGCR